ncbi:MAG: hypothetical protein LBK54_06720 [Propionibacteriaceae bacterium]|jgi:hypothetical protein|nr:hypothetical protein [Propionibacteriaceae bacterium]
MEARRFFLGGGLRTAGFWSLSRASTAVAGVGGTVFLAVVALLATGQPVAPVLVAGVAFMVWLVVKAVRAVRSVVREPDEDRFERFLARRAGLNDHVEGSRPPLVLAGRRVMGVAATGDDPPLAVVEHGGKRPFFTAVVALAGATRGLATVAEEDRAASAFGKFLTGLADPVVPVDQVDVMTRVWPADLGPWERWAEAQPIRSGLAAALDDSARLVTAMASQHRSFLIVRMPIAAVAGKARSESGRADRDTVFDLARATVGDVARRAKTAGLGPSFGLTPSLLAGLVHHLFVPSAPLDRWDGDADWWEAVPSFSSSPDGVALVARDESRSTWWHSVVSVRQGGWPSDPVDATVLERLTAGLDGAPIRTVVAQFPLIERSAAVVRARGASALAEADATETAMKGQVSTGDAERRQDLGRWLLDDLSMGAAATTPSLRLMLSAPGRHAALDARQAAAARFQELGFWRLDWHLGDQGRAVAACLPFGLGTKGLRR